MNPPLYELKEVGQVYGLRQVLDVNHLRIESGSITGLVGPNGSGKSTLMQILAFVEAPAAGKIFFQGRCLSEVDLEMR